MVATLGQMLANAAPAIVTSLGVGAAKSFGSQVGSGAGRSVSDTFFTPQQQNQQRLMQQQQQQNQGLFGAIGGGVGGVVDGAIALPGRIVGGALGGVGSVLSGVGNFLSGNRQQQASPPSSEAQQRFIAMQQQGYR